MSILYLIYYHQLIESTMSCWISALLYVSV